jgi:glycosyltransferase involved in cell wall biosynthesis
VVGNAWIVTGSGITDSNTVRERASQPSLSAESAPGWRRFVPTVCKTAAKDARHWLDARRFSIAADGPWHDSDVQFVWQRHELFEDAGLRLARELGVPSVLFVPATLVWQSEQWGTHRPGWSRLLERRGEVPPLRSADLVACGTERVAQEVTRLGVPADRIIITPTGVDLEQFAGDHDGPATRRRLGLEDRFVVGWVGSFRPFHALDLAIAAAKRVDGSALLLVGDGPERARVEACARREGVDIVTTGTVPHAELPAYLDAMDVGLVVASDHSFHYSPLKLAEYLAAGLPVVVPDVREMRRRFVDDESAAVLVPPGDAHALGDALARLRDDPALMQRLAAAARSTATGWSWDHQVERILDALN